MLTGATSARHPEGPAAAAREGGYTTEQIASVDRTPSIRRGCRLGLPVAREESVPHFKASKDRLTLLSEAK